MRCVSSAEIYYIHTVFVYLSSMDFFFLISPSLTLIIDSAIAELPFT